MRAALILFASLAVAVSCSAQGPRLYKLSGSPANALPLSNVVNDIVVRGDTLWMGTERGLQYTSDGGSSWLYFSNNGVFDEKGISAIAIRGDIIWVATAYTFKQDDQSLPAGGGLYRSTDRGLTWKNFAQPIDTGTVNIIPYGINNIRSLAITTAVNNITYDIALTAGAVWTANYAGMLRKSLDSGKTWQRVVLPPDGPPKSIKPTDSLHFDLAPIGGEKLGLQGNLNHRVFSVYASNDSTIWVGTAAGINKSTDGGISWQHISAQDTGQTISGNFVVAINEMRRGTQRTLWAATINAESQSEVRGVSFSRDGGATWSATLLGEFAHNISFKDSIIYAATDRGLFRSPDDGATWQKAGTIYDPNSLHRFVAPEVFAANIHNDEVWVGGPEGVAMTLDRPGNPFGTTWKVFRTYQSLSSETSTYSFPSPFSPGDEPVRVHFKMPSTGDGTITIRIFDFAMQPVRTLLHAAPRTVGQEYDEIWNGATDRGNVVANGVYFYRIEFGSGQSPAWGKIFVLK
ncbi:MAG: exo-alpha-sialidase [Ignavibacteriales bacterium]|nr:exo-alpha-sialidase [Ignavibacteriales bacterium]